MHSQKGHALWDIMDNMDGPLSIVSSWLCSTHKMGKGRYHDAHPGATYRMAPEQISELRGSAGGSDLVWVRIRNVYRQDDPHARQNQI